MPVDIPAEGDFGAAFGAARLGLIAAEGADPFLICQPPVIERTIEPEGALVNAFVDAHNAYKSHYPAIKGVQHFAWSPNSTDIAFATLNEATNKEEVEKDDGWFYRLKQLLIHLDSLISEQLEVQQNLLQLLLLFFYLSFFLLALAFVPSQLNWVCCTLLCSFLSD